MYCDLPLLKRCCFCFPLRPGLIAWAYIKLVATILYIGSTTLFVDSNALARLYKYNYTTFVIQMLILLAFVADVIFNIIFLVSAHKKNHELMKKCLYYNIFIFALTSVIFLLAFAFATYLVCMWGFFLYELLIFFLAIGFLNAVIQLYHILLIRSEVHKLSNDCYFKFENHAAASQCVMGIGNMNFGIAAPPKEDKVQIINEEVLPGKD